MLKSNFVSFPENEFKGFIMHGQDLTKGNILNQLWSLAWPMMLSMLFFSLYNLVDAFWVGKLSPDAIAAVSISQISLFAMISLSMGIAVGSSVLMGMNIGAGKKSEAEKILGQGFLLMALSALAFSAIALVFRAQILTFSGATGGIFPLALPYFNITASGSILMFLMMLVSITFNAQGDNFTSTKIFALSTVVNAVLDPIFIFGWKGFPALGIAGAAYATLLSQAVYLALGLRILMGPAMMVRLRFSNLRMRWASVKRVIEIGFPASLTQVLNPLGFSALMATVSSTFYEPGAAAFSIGFRIEFFAFIPAIGFGFSVMAMMGQNIGAGNFTRVHDAFKTAALMGSGAAAIVGLLVFFFAHNIVGSFTQDPVVVAYAVKYFHIVPLGYVFFSLAFIESNVFQGLGRSWPGFWITFSRVGVAIFLANLSVKVFSFPIQAVWISIAVSSIAVSLLGFIWVLHAMKRMKPNPVSEATAVESGLAIP